MMGIKEGGDIINTFGCFLVVSPLEEHWMNEWDAVFTARPPFLVLGVDGFFHDEMRRVCLFYSLQHTYNITFVATM